MRKNRLYRLYRFLVYFLTFLLIFENVFSGYIYLLGEVFGVKEAYGANVVCLQSNNTVYPPYYDSGSGYCVAYPIDSQGNCPTGYIYNPSLSKCVSFPTCDELGYVYDFTTRGCIQVSSVGGGSSGSYLDPNKDYCGVDLNNDGDLSQNEIFPCIQTPQGMLCSYGQAECSAQYSPPTCPSGGSYNPSTGKCEANSTPMPINDIKQVVQHVSESRGYNPSSSYPVSITEDGRNMIWEMGWCTKDLDQYYKYRGCHSNTWTVTIVRPEAIGYAGLDILGGNDRAPGAVAVGCPSGYSYNPGTGKCEANPICSQGTFQNGQCFTGYTCPLGNYQCHQVNDKWMCSPIECSKIGNATDDSPDFDPEGFIDDGQGDESGNCLGQIYIFNGFKMRCRKAGVKTGFQNCCDEANGKLYDSTGSYDTFMTIKNTITAIMFAKQIAEVGYYASKIASGAYYINKGQHVWIMSNTGVVKSFPTGTPAAEAILAVQQGMDTTTAINTATTTYVTQHVKVYGGDIALMVVNLAVGQLIDDPILQSVVNLAATVTLASGALKGLGISLALSNPALAIPMAVIQLGMAFFAGSCDSQDIITSTMDKSGRCHYVGDRCLKKWFGSCVQKAKVFCCFNSKLARIIHEQGRSQLSTFGLSGGWGSAKNPNCRGFTPEEFQALDFGKIDLSEYYADIQRNIRQNIESVVNQQMQETYQGLSSGVRGN